MDDDTDADADGEEVEIPLLDNQAPTATNMPDGVLSLASGAPGLVSSIEHGHRYAITDLLWLPTGNNLG